MQKFEKIIALIKHEVVPAMGCTEPAAVALAAAYAANQVEGEIEKIELFVSPSILKNGMGVGIPNTGLVGLDIAAALGAIVAEPEKELEILGDLDESQLAQGKALMDKITTKMEASSEKVYIKAIVKSKSQSATATIRCRHNFLYQLEVDGKTIFQQEIKQDENCHVAGAEEFRLKDYFEFANGVAYEELLKLDLGEKINRRISEFGLSEDSGMGVGKTILQNIKDGILGDDIHNYATALTAAATDARMSGCNLPVISNSGSGNQGLSITLPIIAASEKLGSSHEKLVRALALGHLVSIHIKNKTGLLSSICGCLSASAGAACGIVLLLGGDFQKMEYAIKNMIGNTTGMLCDGAKEGCSLKVATTTSAAVQAALLANMGRSISPNDGIVTDDLDETIDNLAKIVKTGMQNTDSTILNIMINKKNNKEANDV